MRPLDPATEAELTKPVAGYALFVEIEYANGFVRAWSGLGDKLLGGEIFKGIGDFGAMSPVGETDEVRAGHVEFTLSGVASDLIGDALAQSRYGKGARAWVALLDPDEEIVGQAVQIFGGLTDVPVISKEATGSTITQSVESELAALERPKERRYTNEDQAIDFPGDRGLEFVPSLQDTQIVWGS